MILGTTGPSVYNQEIKSLVEDYFGATPLYINQDKKDDLEWVLKNIDGLILAGGRDITPIAYGQEFTNGENMYNFDYPRDIRETYLIKRCFDLNIPILGICRGHQFLGVYHNLYLIRDISGSDVTHNPNSQKMELEGLPSHFIYCLEKHQNNFWLKEMVNSFHHQGLHFRDSQKGLEYYLENGIDVIGYANLTYDNGQKKAQKIIEVMKGVGNRWISTQNHPELDYKENKASRIVLGKFKEMIK